MAGSWFSTKQMIACTYILGRLLKDKLAWFETPGGLRGWATVLVFHQLLIIGIYSVAIDVVGLSVGGPYYSVLLVLHAIVLLFMAYPFSRGEVAARFCGVNNAKDSDGFWMHLDAFGSIWMHLDAFGCFWMHLDDFGAPQLQFFKFIWLEFVAYEMEKSSNIS